MSWLTGLNRPWLHFIVLGTALYYLQGMMYPAPKPVVGPLSEARMEALEQQWLASLGRPLTAEQKQRMIRSELDRDMLFQRAVDLELHLHDTVVYQRLLRNMRFLGLDEGRSDEEMYEQALDMRLHLGDEVVKRRMIQVMEQIMLVRNPPPAISEAELNAEFKQRREELRRPPHYSIQHLYFTRERRHEVEQVIARIDEEGLSASEARTLSSPFLPGYRFSNQTPEQLARQFGAAFVRNMEQAGPQAGQWLGPVASTYGLHYVWVEAMEEPRDATLEEVRAQLLRDLESRARADALEGSVAAMREDFEVRI